MRSQASENTAHYRIKEKKSLKISIKDDIFNVAHFVSM